MSYPWVPEDDSLAKAIEAAIDSYDYEYFGSWFSELDESKRQPIDQFLDLCEWGVDAIAAFATTDAQSLKRLRQTIEDPFARKAIHQELELALAREYCNKTEKMADRAVELISLILNQDEVPSEATHRFLRRVSRCYVAGFFPECVIQCRAVMENAIRAKFIKEDLAYPDTSMGKRLDFMVRLRWLSPETRRDAWAVWKRGSKAAHEDPEVTKAALGTIVKTAGVMTALEERR